MNKKQFIKHLRAKDTSKPDKIRACQFFIDNYPVLLSTNRGQYWASINIEITGGETNTINLAFNKLAGRVGELEQFNN